MKPFSEQMSDFDARRRAARVTDKDLSIASGVDVFMISKYRNGHRKPSVDNWIALHNALEAVIRARAGELKELLK